MGDEELERIRTKKMKELQSNIDKAKGSKPDKPRSQIIHLNASNFQKVVSSRRPVLVDFWASWCPPCRRMAPVFESLAEKCTKQIVFAKLNVDENPSIAAKYGVTAIPTFILFLKGSPVDQVIGAVGEQGLKNLLKGFLQHQDFFEE